MLSGGDGDDVLRGGFGDDVIRPGEGSDRAAGSFGDDVFIADTLGEDAPEVIFGGFGRDTLFIEVAAGEVEAVEAEIASSFGGRAFKSSLTFGDHSLHLFGIERVVVGERGELPPLAPGPVDPAAFRSPVPLQGAYEDALSAVSAATLDLVNTAAAWNVVDPFLADIA